MSDERRAIQEDMADELHFAMMSEVIAAGYITLLAEAAERGDADLGVDTGAWENAMLAVDWSLGEQVAGRVRGPTSVTADDVERMRRLAKLGAEVLAGSAVASEFLALAPGCIESLFGPRSKEAARHGIEAIKMMAELQ
jgi:hypothetical protein